MSKRIILALGSSNQMHKLGALLEGAGYAVTYAGDEKEALHLSRKVRPKALITKANIPEIDGLTICRRLKLDPMISNIPVVMLDRLDHSDSAVRALDAGVADYIPGDIFESENLLQSIQRLVGATSAFMR